MAEQKKLYKVDFTFYHFAESLSQHTHTHTKKTPSKYRGKKKIPVHILLCRRDLKIDKRVFLVAPHCWNIGSEVYLNSICCKSPNKTNKTNVSICTLSSILFFFACFLLALRAMMCLV